MSPVIKHHKRLTLLVTGTLWCTHQRGSDANPGADTPMLKITDKKHCQNNSVLLQLLHVQTHFRIKRHHLPVIDPTAKTSFFHCREDFENIEITPANPDAFLD